MKPGNTNIFIAKIQNGRLPAGFTAWDFFVRLEVIDNPTKFRIRTFMVAGGLFS